MKALVGVFVGLTACQTTQDVPAMPWLYGLSDVVSSDRTSDELARRMETWSDRGTYDPNCPTASHPAIELVADVAPSAGLETIWVSLAHGVAVFDREGQLVTETPGYSCSGSADELQVLAAGDAFGAPTIAIAATTGGHRASSTWVSLLRVGPDRQLEAVFTGTVEERDGETVKQGAVVVLPNSLIYSHPNAKPVLRVYNSVARAYLDPAEPIDNSHDDGPAITVSSL